MLQYQQNESAQPFAKGLKESIAAREQVLTLGSIAHHKGVGCVGGALVGSKEGVKWFRKKPETVNLSHLKPLTKNPALDAYWNSIFNLGVFNFEGERPDTDEEAEDFSFENLELSELGILLAEAYGSRVDGLSVSRQFADRKRVASIRELANFGKRGCLCALREFNAPDRDLLREVFFSFGRWDRGASHHLRRQSLLLVLSLCQQFSTAGWRLDEVNFAAAVYYGRLEEDDDELPIGIPEKLQDVAARWRMFQFHQFMGVALEGLFAWLIARAEPERLAGVTLAGLVDDLGGKALQRELSELLDIRLAKSFGSLTPQELLGQVGLMSEAATPALSSAIDQRISTGHPLAEDTLEAHLRSGKYLHSPLGLALPLVLLAVTLSRFQRWNETGYGQWLANAAENTFLDLVPPLVVKGLAAQFKNWWCTPFAELAQFALSRYVVRQHISLSYEKSAAADRCLLQVDGDRILAFGSYGRLGMKNPRLVSAAQVLTDLGLIEAGEDEDFLSTDGMALLKGEVGGWAS
ncbi:MAG: hypothetical protein ABI639_06310 [Thermoanaerobaculia bacterium]